jgi:LuxR family maltose regulon positive regulatory protein
MGRDGVRQMIVDAESALAGLPRNSHFRPTAMIALAIGSLLLGQDDHADEVFAAAAAEAERLGATDTRIVAVTERSLIAAARADHTAAETFATEARELAEEGHLEAYATTSMAFAVAARACLRHGRWDEARDLLAQVQALRERLVRTRLPWLTLQTLLEEARAYLALRDTGSVQSVLAEIRRLLVEHPRVGVLADQAGALEREAKAIPRRKHASVAGLTAAELRLLPFLATHLSFREIGEALYVSRNTVKTQAISVYRKLGVTSRSEAITRALELGLVELGTKRS